VRLLELLVTLAPLLRPPDKDLLALELSVVELVAGLLGVLVVGEVDETEALVGTALVPTDSSRDDGTEG